jgi:hypothetical protein
VRIRTGNVEVSQGTHQGQHQGLKAEVWFGSYNDDCNRITSINVLSSSGNGFVEFGWVLGYSSCDDNLYTTPRTFTWWKQDGGSSNCRVLTAATADLYHNLSIADGDSDTTWLAKKNGSLYDTINVNFDRGDVATNGERDCTCDTAYAHFKELEFQKVATGATWLAWNDPYLFFDSDDNFHWVKDSDTEHEVVHD